MSLQKKLDLVIFIFMTILGRNSSHRARWRRKNLFSRINSISSAFFGIVDLGRSEHIYYECCLNKCWLNKQRNIFTEFWTILARFDVTFHVLRIIVKFWPQLKVFPIFFYIFPPGFQQPKNPTMSKTGVISLPTWWIPFVTSSWFLVVLWCN